MDPETVDLVVSHASTFVEDLLANEVALGRVSPRRASRLASTRPNHRRAPRYVVWYAQMLAVVAVGYAGGWLGWLIIDADDDGNPY